jgi:TetR/AcrR family transcriptional regulator, mexJK operon transcriptional repressor
MLMAIRDQAGGGKRQEILDAATMVFSENGFVGASLDEVVAAAAVSKQTLYKHFTDKASLFRQIVLEIGNEVDAQFLDLPEPAAIDDVEGWIQALALRLTRSVMDPKVQRIRRLVIAEAPRFPDLAIAYWERGFQRVIATVAEHFRELADAGKLHAPDPLTAAQHFAGLLLWIPSNRTMFSGRPDVVTTDELEGYARAGAVAFLRAYPARGASVEPR